MGLAGWRRQAQYLSTVNLSSIDNWNYSFKTHPRPRGRATEVIYTEYDLPERTRQPHDVIVDSECMAWYASFGEQILGGCIVHGKTIDDAVREAERQNCHLDGRVFGKQITPPYEHNIKQFGINVLLSRDQLMAMALEEGFG